MRSVLLEVEGGRKCIGTRVSMELATEILGWVSIHITTDLDSGSLSG